MVLESIAAIHAKKGRNSDKYRQTLNLCQILENHPIKLIFSRYGFLNKYFDIYFLVQFCDGVVENCQKICWFDMECTVNCVYCVYCQPDFKRCWVGTLNPCSLENDFLLIILSWCILHTQYMLL